jgi:aldehyde dehydrogenase (NAD+)
VFASVNPARPADELAVFAESGPADVDAAVGAAADAQRAWARVPVPVRAEVIARAGVVLAHAKPSLAALVTREVGKIGIEAAGDVQEAIDMAGFIAGQGRAAIGATYASELTEKVAWTTRQPVGVVGLITPWNFPVAIPSWKIFPALLAGNGVVLKPSELAPVCADAFVSILEEAGVPKGLVNVVHGHGEAGATLVTHPGVRAVGFTGSAATGRRVAASAMASGPRLVSLELGGKNAMVVLPDADLDLACDGALFGAFGTAGQRCTSTSRLIVHRDATSLVDRITERASALVIGDPADPGTDVGPVIDAGALKRIDAMVQGAIEEGAELVSGGRVRHVDGCEGGTFYEPTILRGVQRGQRIAREEVFGPVLVVLEVESAGEAVDVVNDSDYGLSAAVYTTDIAAALRAVDRIDTGIVYVNAPTIGAEIHLPFGGTKHTGNGYREAGVRGIEQFSQVKSVYVDYSGRLQRAQIDTEGRS